MKKRLVTLLCTLGLLLGLCVYPVSADTKIFFLALNDTLPAAESRITPIQSGGWIYVPITVFNSRVSGVSFGINYGFTENNQSLIMYNHVGKTLTFDINTSTATGSNGETIMPGRVLPSGGIIYIPAYPVCDYFGLSYSYLTSEYGPVLRIKDGNAQLSDASFLSSADSLMRARYNAANPTPAPTPSAPSPGSSSSTGNKPETTTKPAVGSQTQQTQEETPQAPKTFSLYVGLRAGGDVTQALNAMDTINATAIVFFPTESLENNASQLRQAAGRGHLVGLIPDGDTPEKRLASALAGSETVARLLHQETWFVLTSDKELADAGFLTWMPTFTLPSSGNADTLYEATYKSGSERSGTTRLLAGTDQPLASLLSRLVKDGDTILQPRETRY